MAERSTTDQGFVQAPGGAQRLPVQVRSVDDHTHVAVQGPVDVSLGRIVDLVLTMPSGHTPGQATEGDANGSVEPTHQLQRKRLTLDTLRLLVRNQLVSTCLSSRLKTNVQMRVVSPPTAELSWSRGARATELVLGVEASDRDLFLYPMALKGDRARWTRDWSDVGFALLDMGASFDGKQGVFVFEDFLGRVLSQVLVTRGWRLPSLVDVKFNPVVFDDEGVVLSVGEPQTGPRLGEGVERGPSMAEMGRRLGPMLAEILSRETGAGDRPVPPSLAGMEVFNLAVGALRSGDLPLFVRYLGRLQVERTAEEILALFVHGIDTEEGAVREALRAYGPKDL